MISSGVSRHFGEGGGGGGGGGAGYMEHIHGPAIYRPTHQALLCIITTNDSTHKRGIVPNRPASDPEYDFSKSMTDIIQVLSCN